jgi:rhomboid protease GluP
MEGVVNILKQMPGWTEEGSLTSPSGQSADTESARWMTVEGIPWMTLLLVAGSAALLAAAGGFEAGLPLGRLLAYGAKSTSLIFDRGETWRLLVANLLHKDVLHLLCNAFVLWNVGGALERAVRSSDYLATLILTALGTTLASAIGADSISLGASGVAFGMLGASAAFGWRRGVRGSLGKHFGLRVVPWALALFAVGLGSTGVDNWGHAGGLVVGLALGFVLEPRAAPANDGPSRRLAGALGAASAALAVGALAAPALPLLGAPHDGPAGVQIRFPLGWRRGGEGPDRLTYTNGLLAGFRSSATVWVGPRACSATGELVRALVEADLWRLLEAGPLASVQVEDSPLPARLGGLVATSVEGTVTTADGSSARVTAVCAVSQALDGSIAVIALEADPTPGHLASRVARGISLPAPLDDHSTHEPSGVRRGRRASPPPRLSRPTLGQLLFARPLLSETRA